MRGKNQPAHEETKDFIENLTPEQIQRMREALKPKRTKAEYNTELYKQLQFNVENEKTNTQQDDISILPLPEEEYNRNDLKILNLPPLFLPEED